LHQNQHFDTVELERRNIKNCINKVLGDLVKNKEGVIKNEK